MSFVNLIRCLKFTILIVFLTTAFFTGCGKKGEEDLRKGKAAYEIKDYKAAAMSFSLAALDGNAEAQYMLAECYELGEGVEEDENESVRWLRKAAEQGYAKAQMRLGVYYSIKEENKEKSESLFKKAFPNLRKDAERGDAEAQYMLAISYLEGIGTEKDKKEGMKLLRKVADQGYVAAKELIEKYEDD